MYVPGASLKPELQKAGKMIGTSVTFAHLDIRSKKAFRMTIVSERLMSGPWPSPSLPPNLLFS